MASKAALFLIANLICFVIANAACPATSPPPPPPPRSTRAPPPPPRSTRAPPPPPKGSCSTPTPPPPPSSTKCPNDALKFGVCADVLGLIKGVTLGSPPTSSCCSLLGGLVDLEAAVCLCTALKANILGISLNIPVDLSLVLNYCGKGAPAGYTCS